MQAYYEARAAASAPCTGLVDFNGTQHSNLSSTELRELGVKFDCGFDAMEYGGLSYPGLANNGFKTLSTASWALFSARENLRTVSPLPRDKCAAETGLTENVRLLEEIEGKLCIHGTYEGEPSRGSKLCFSPPAPQELGESTQGTWKGVALDCGRVVWGKR